jgi:hypothetical protein
MKSTFSIWLAAMTFAGTLGVTSARAANAPRGMSQKPVEVTGCLQQGPVAREYLIKTSDGTVWGINETDMYMNNHVGQTVTVVGDAMRPTAAERTDGGATHYLNAKDLVVDSETCQK